MKRLRRKLGKSLAVLALSAASIGAWIAGNSLFNNVQFARASQEVDAARQQLSQVPDTTNIYRNVAKVVEPSVVKIDVRKTVRGVHRGVDPDTLRRFFERNGNAQPPDNADPNNNNDDNADDDGTGDSVLAMGEGSGVIMEAGDGVGFVLTNNHVAGGASEITVTLADGREIQHCKLIGADPKTDLAVVRINADRLITARWGNSDYLEKGDLICAFGSPFGFVGSMTHGIVSALNRDHVGIISNRNFAYENFIQVDAPINPGNSGGPLVNLKGEVVGINTAIASKTGVFNGIGFAIPSNLAKPVYEQLKEKGKVVRGWLGVEIGNVGDSGLLEAARSVGFTGDTGVFVRQVINNAPSDGKLLPSDVITEINGKKVENVAALRTQVAMMPPNTEVKLTIVRSGKTQPVNVTIAEQPDDLLSHANSSRPKANGGPKEEASTTTTTETLGVRLAAPTGQLLDRSGLPDGVEGALVTQVQPNSPAAQAGIRSGDLITRIGDRSVTSVKDASEALTKLDMNKGIAFSITNKDGQRFVFVKMAK